MKNWTEIMIGGLAICCWSLSGCAKLMTSGDVSQSDTLAEVDPYLPDPNSITNLDGWEYAWGDEFNYNGTPDETIWDFERGFLRGNELQYYRKENAQVTDGKLLISGKKEAVLNERYDPTSNDYRLNTQFSEYTSASLIGKGKKHFLFGRIEVRAKITPSNGSFPAIWTCGYNKDWPNNGEIDIMEYYLADLGDGEGKVPVLTSNFCVGGDPNGPDGIWSQNWNSVFTKRTYYEDKYNDPDWINKYHVYRMDWDEETISLYVDDELRNSIQIDEFKNFDGSITFHNPQFMILNLAIKNHGAGLEDNYQFEVDYFRVYQRTVDLVKPTKVENIQVSAITATSCTLSWDPSTDNVEVYRYDVYKNGSADGAFVGSTTEPNIHLDNLESGTTMEFRVRALDAHGNYADISEPLQVNTPELVEYDGDCSMASGSANMVPDGSMENLATTLSDAYLAQQGFVGSWGNESWGGLRVAEGNAYCGQKCIRLEPESGELKFPVTWENGKTYVIRALVKTTGVGFEFAANNAFGGSNPNAVFPLPNTDGKWMLMEYEFTTGSESGDGSASFYSWSGTGVAYMDNWEVFEK